MDGLGIHDGKPKAWGSTCFVGDDNKLSAISTGLIGLFPSVLYIEEISLCRVGHPALAVKLHALYLPRECCVLYAYINNY